MSEMPKVKFPLPTRLLKATGALRVQVTGFDGDTNEFIYTTQFRWWHPLALLITVGAAVLAAICYLIGAYSKMEWRSYNG